MKLYEISQAYEAVVGAIEAGDGELTPELATELDAITEAFDQKAEAIQAIIQQKRAEVAAYKNEAARLTGLAQSSERALEGLKRYLAQEMLRVGREKLKTGLGSLWVRTNQRIQWIGDPRLIPEPYRREKQTVEPDLKLCQQTIKDGGILPDGFTIEVTCHLGML